MNCVKQKSQTACQNPRSGGFKLAVSRRIFSGALLWLIPFFPAAGLAQTSAVEVRAAVEAMIEPSTRPRVAPSQVIQGLIRKHGRQTVADAAIGPLSAALNGTNYQTRESVAWALLELKDPRAAEPLIEFLRVENLGDWGAEKALIAIGEPVVGPLVVAFEAGKATPHFRRKSAKVLGEFKTSNEATGQIRRNPLGGRSFSPRLRCSLLTDPRWDMRVARASSGRKIPCRERHRI